MIRPLTQRDRRRDISDRLPRKGCVIPLWVGCPARRQRRRPCHRLFARWPNRRRSSSAFPRRRPRFRALAYHLGRLVGGRSRRRCAVSGALFHGSSETRPICRRHHFSRLGHRLDWQSSAQRHRTRPPQRRRRPRLLRAVARRTLGDWEIRLCLFSLRARRDIDWFNRCRLDRESLGCCFDWRFRRAGQLVAHRPIQPSLFGYCRLGASRPLADAVLDATFQRVRQPSAQSSFGFSGGKLTRSLTQ